MISKKPPRDLPETDRDALQRALDLDGGLPEMVKQSGWLAAAEQASFSAQHKSLGLRPWQDAPVYADLADLDRSEPGHRSKKWEAARLLQKLLDAGLSRYEPSPAEALAKLKKDALAADGVEP